MNPNNHPIRSLLLQQQSIGTFTEATRQLHCDALEKWVKSAFAVISPLSSFPKKTIVNHHQIFSVVSHAVSNVALAATAGAGVCTVIIKKDNEQVVFLFTINDVMGYKDGQPLPEEVFCRVFTEACK